ncbi:TPA: Fe-S cluster assembly protein SufB [Candidatus Collierbacteria bacterium]|nr:Fe-S cluster assembly protein SufB [Candidatus Collierbacteria bacterium]
MKQILNENSGTGSYRYKSQRGLSENLVREISRKKGEPAWMLKMRLVALEQFEAMPIPSWGADLSQIKWGEIYYYLRPVDLPYKSWKEVPDSVRRVFTAIGVPEAEKAFLAGVTAQFDSEKIYGSLKASLAKQGVVFLSMDEGLTQYPEIVKKYFGKIVPYGDNKLAALNTAVWSGGRFVYVPAGIQVDLPLQAYFRINAEKAGQFERTLIVVEEGARVHYVEGCSAPAYSSASLHAAVVEVIVKERAKVRYTTVQNWYKTVYNLVTKRATVAKDATMEWVDCNLGSRVTMKYPSCILQGEGAHGEMLSMAVAGNGQDQDTGAKMIHLAPRTTSRIISKSISQKGGRASYRGQVKMGPAALGSRSKVTCDALIMDPLSRSDTYPNNQILTGSSQIEHEAYVSRVGEEQIKYLMSRGLTEEEAQTLIIRGFLEPIVAELPLEYAVELNRLVKLEMIGSVG